MKIIETNTDTMRTDTESISGCISNLKNASRSIEELLARLSASWEGDAAGTYESGLRGDLERLNQLIGLTEELNQGTKSAKTAYERCETNVADIISAVKV